jgi:hypothetical protein
MPVRSECEPFDSVMVAMKELVSFGRYSPPNPVPW